MTYREKRQEREIYAWILDYLPYGNPKDQRPVYQKKPLLYAIGEKLFVLMELVPIQGLENMNERAQEHERIPISDKDKSVIDHVKSRIRYSDLTQNSRAELPFVIQKIVKRYPERFVEFYNHAQPITSRLHSLELLPGIGNKLMWEIVNERKKGFFSDFNDITKRVKGIYRPEKHIADRVIEELKDANIKYRLVTIK